MATNKDESLTYENVIGKLKTPTDTEKCELAKPSYDDLLKHIDDLSYQLSVLIEENNALKWSLTMAHKEMTTWKERSNMWQDNYYEEHKRANKLYDKLWKEIKEEEQ